MTITTILLNLLLDYAFNFVIVFVCVFLCIVIFELVGCARAEWYRSIIDWFHIFIDRPFPGASEKEIRFMRYALKCHRDTNHVYGRGKHAKSYKYHLRKVRENVEMFITLVPMHLREAIRCAAFGHDTGEDCRQTHNDNKKVGGEMVADFIYAVTNEKGKNRKQRANEKYYKGIRDLEAATVLKLADKLANINESILTKQMMHMHISDWPTIRMALYEPKYDIMFKHIDNKLGYDPTIGKFKVQWKS